MKECLPNVPEKAEKLCDTYYQLMKEDDKYDVVLFLLTIYIPHSFHMDAVNWVEPKFTCGSKSVLDMC